MMTSKEYSPFLKWNRDDPFSVDSVAQPFVSLASMIGNGYEFDEDLLQKSSTFLSSMTSLLQKNNSFDDLLTAVGRDSPDTAAVAYHQPTLDFVCSSRIPMAFQSLLSKEEHEDTHQFIIWKMNDIINRLKEGGAEFWRRGRILLRTLEQEGFYERLEQTLLHDKSSEYGNAVATLDVSFNSIAIIPPSISQLTLLVKVNFGFNKIDEVPNELFRLPILTHLILSHNKLTSLPSDLAMSPKVEMSLGFVDPLSNSMIYEKTGTGTHPGAVLCPLERLLLALNQLTSVPPLLSQFRKLHTLSLVGNRISELPCHFFRSLPNLSRLDLSFNKLTHLIKSIEYSPFLNWNPPDPGTIDPVASPFDSLEYQGSTLLGCFFGGHWTRLPRPRFSVYGFDSCALIVIPSIDIQRNSVTHSCHQTRRNPSVDHLAHVRRYQEVEGKWSRNSGQRKNIVAHTGTGRVQRSSRTNTATRQSIGRWAYCGEAACSFQTHKLISILVQRRLLNDQHTILIMESERSPNLFSTIGFFNTI
ncbi:hypothetical protein BLNAU_19930 [Blattamonas nauphoetae]|uniref:Uncharacterized protein n=1 Tax=Blattamonas nauphoetae TaxID=2049346 RepID=A0ABQ9X059_9EUKA|nr:hypothetical protein BLNAU_19930 [Blattamonas nauphoetae]